MIGATRTSALTSEASCRACLSRNLGLITGASVMGTVFAVGAASSTLMTASPQALTAGMRATFAVAAVLVVVALAIALLGQTLARRR